MTFVALLFGLLVMALGLLGVVSPARLLGTVRWGSARGLAITAGLRIAFGAALLLAAEASRAPLVFQVVGVVSLFAGFALPLAGVERWASMVAWWSSRSPGFLRAWCAVAALFGAFVAWAAVG